jgi:hypothetical protein
MYLHIGIANAAQLGMAAGSKPQQVAKLSML